MIRSSTQKIREVLEASCWKHRESVKSLGENINKTAAAASSSFLSRSARSQHVSLMEVTVTLEGQGRQQSGARSEKGLTRGTFICGQACSDLCRLFCIRGWRSRAQPPLLAWSWCFYGYASQFQFTRKQAGENFRQYQVPSPRGRLRQLGGYR